MRAMFTNMVKEDSMEKIMGYARVSSSDQNIDRQVAALKEYVPMENIVIDKVSGKDLQRPGYMALKGVLGLREGDTLIITSLDRLSRNKQDIKNELEWFKQNHIRLKILDLPTTLVQVPDNQNWMIEMINNILLEVLSSMAEQERKTIHKRQREGIEAAKAKGKHLGRPSVKYPEDWEEYYRKWKNKEITATEFMSKVRLKKTSFYKLIKDYNRVN